MPKSHRLYPPEFRQRIIELVRKGRTPEELGRQFEPSAQAIRNWVQQGLTVDAGAPPGRPDDGRAGGTAPAAARQSRAP